MCFIRNEWVAGAKAVFEKFADYVPRQETPSWLAGGKNIVVDRVEWITIPDQAVAAAALQNGEVDWLEFLLPDLLPLLRKNRNLGRKGDRSPDALVRRCFPFLIRGNLDTITYHPLTKVAGLGPAPRLQ